MIGTDLAPGSILGEYRVSQMLGQSQLGQAYLALHVVQGHRAIVITLRVPETRPVWERTQLELDLARKGDALTRLTHPHILPIYACGMQSDSIYLITALAEEPSLAQALKQHGRFTPQQTLPLLKQLAAALDYAHNQGVVHGMLSLSNVIVSSDFNVRIAGFGLRTVLEAQRKGQQADARSDVYALGLMLFELLSGIPPLSVTQRGQQIPAVHDVCQEVPEAFDLVLRNMLEQDPAKRTQRAGAAATAFERVEKILDTGHWATPTAPRPTIRETQITLPPTVNWLDEPVNPTKDVQFGQAGSSPNSLGGMDPFAWWASTSSEHKAIATGRLNAARPRPRPARQSRRKVITLLSAGTAAGLLAASGVGLAHLLQSAKPPQSASTLSPTATAGHTMPTAPVKPAMTKTAPTPPAKTPQPAATAQPTQAQQPTPAPQNGATPTPQPTATAQPTPTPSPTPQPTHTGTVIGHTSQGMNSAVNFTNPADGRSSLLVHLGNGNWAACEAACTHEGVAVYYDAGIQKLVCPRHGAIFDPANGFAYKPGSGPGSFAALPNVTIRVNTDGTITTG